MAALNLLSPTDIALSLAGRAKQARLQADLSQAGLAERSGVSLGSLKRFERMGAISLDSLIRLAIALRLEGGFGTLLEPPEFKTLDEVLAVPKQRQRGRRK
jgi:transcriptional regulator with XRE-family HTH domain